MDLLMWERLLNSPWRNLSQNLLGLCNTQFENRFQDRATRRIATRSILDPNRNIPDITSYNDRNKLDNFLTHHVHSEIDKVELRHIMLPRPATLRNVVTQTLSMLLIAVILQSMEENLSSTSEDRNKKWRSQRWSLQIAQNNWTFSFRLPTPTHMSACRMPDSEVAGQILSEGTSWIFFNRMYLAYFQPDSYILVTQMKIRFSKSFTCQRKIEDMSIILKTTSRNYEKNIEMHNTLLNIVTNSSKFTGLNYGI